MAATAIARSSRYITPGVTKIYYLATIASPGAPIRSELNAGTDISREVQAIEGFVVNGALVEEMAVDSKFTGTGGGRTSTEESALAVYADKTGADCRALMAIGEEGFVVFLDGGDVSGSLMDIYPVEVVSHGKIRSVEGGERATIRILFGIPSEPFVDVEIPA